MDLMLSAIANGDTVSTTVVAPELVVRRSTSAPA
jgi:hypothetical protein